ncbi:hypothetical protein M8368_30455, partial [Enterobacter kobei]|nr:hypothetical protein [Enterobacter kobei]
EKGEVNPPLRMLNGVQKFFAVLWLGRDSFVRFSPSVSLRRMADDINVLYTAIKLYLARMPKDELAEEESRRWAEIIEMSLNLEQASDIVERMGSEIA